MIKVLFKMLVIVIAAVLLISCSDSSLKPTSELCYSIAFDLIRVEYAGAHEHKELIDYFDEVGIDAELIQECRLHFRQSVHNGADAARRLR